MCLWSTTLMVTQTGHLRLGGNLHTKLTAGCGTTLKSMTIGSVWVCLYAYIYKTETDTLFFLKHHGPITSIWLFYIEGQAPSAISKSERRKTGKGPGKGLLRAWPPGDNQSFSAGCLSMTGLCLNLTRRQRLVWT